MQISTVLLTRKLTLSCASQPQTSKQLGLERKLEDVNAVNPRKPTTARAITPQAAARNLKRVHKVLAAKRDINGMVSSSWMTVAWPRPTLTLRPPLPAERDTAGRLQA